MTMRRALLLMLMACAGCNESPETEMAARREAYHARVMAVEATRAKAVKARHERKLRAMRRHRGW